MGLTRRDFAKGVLAAFVIPNLSSASTKSHELNFVGIGFSSLAGDSDIEKAFPHVSRYLLEQDFFSEVESFVYKALKDNYSAGVIRVGENGAISSSEVVGLLLAIVSVDFELNIKVPGGVDKTDGRGDLNIMHIFPSLRIVSIRDLPDSDRRGGRIDLVTSIPFRAGKLHFLNKSSYENNVEEILKEEAIPFLVEKVSSSSFVESFERLSLKVDKISISEKARTKLLASRGDFFLEDGYWGRNLSSAAVSKASLKVIPYGSDDDIYQTTLTSVFNDSSNLLHLLNNIGGYSDYLMDIDVFAIKKKAVESSRVFEFFSRGVAVKLKLKKGDGTLLSELRIFKSSKNKLPKDFYSIEYQYDQRYLNEITINLFETFFSGIIQKDWNTLKSIGLKEQKHADAVNLFSEHLSKCI